MRAHASQILNQHGVDGSSARDHPLAHKGQPIQDVAELTLCAYATFVSTTSDFLLDDYLPFEIGLDLDEPAIRAVVHQEFPMALVDGLKRSGTKAKIGKSGYGTRISTGKRFDSTARRYRSYLGKSAYGSGPTNFNR